MDSIILAGGCFWSFQDKLSRLPGVIKTIAGYAGGETENPQYEIVCSGKSGHAECVLVEYDETRLTLTELLTHFFTMHDSTQYLRQGPDEGPQYRSAIFCFDSRQEGIAQVAKAKAAQRERQYGGVVCTEIRVGVVFYPAEEYHQNYWAKRCKI